jgi:hypothetical protein
MDKKISKNEAIRMMSDVDFKVYEQELAEFVNWCLENQKEFTEEFYLEDDTLILYFMNQELILRPRIVFEGKKVGRPSLGTTKKVSITLPDEIWDMIEKRKEKLGASQSATLRMMIEGYFYSDTEEEEA